MIYINNNEQEKHSLECEDENLSEILEKVGKKKKKHISIHLNALNEGQEDLRSLSEHCFNDILVRLERIEGAILYLMEKIQKKEEKKRKNDYIFNLD